VTATTGIGALNISGVTIHSWSGLGSDPLPEPAVRSLLARKPVVRKRWRAAKALVIDEVSMLDAAYLTSLDIAARISKGSSKPFGGIQIIALGDFFQLPPVPAKGGEREERKGRGGRGISLRVPEAPVDRGHPPFSFPRSSSFSLAVFFQERKSGCCGE